VIVVRRTLGPCRGQQWEDGRGAVAACTHANRKTNHKNAFSLINPITLIVLLLPYLIKLHDYSYNPICYIVFSGAKVLLI